jgi:PAS domain S-box-containing protein
VQEFRILSDITPLAGFLTYGELYADTTGYELLNITTTVLGLSESVAAIHGCNPALLQQKRPCLSTTGLIHLVEKTMDDLEAEVLEHKKSIAMLNQYQQAINTTYIVSMTDPKGIITWANDHFCRISGYSFNELIGQQHNIVRHPDMPKSTFQELWKTIQDKQIWHGFVKNLHKDGSSYYVNATVFPLLDHEGTITGYISIREDLTGLEEARQQALAAEQAKGDFLATMSHEIRTPLNGLIGFIDLLGRTDLDNTQQRYISIVNSSIASLLKIVNDILDFSKLQQGKLEIEQLQVNPSRELDKILPKLMSLDGL